MPSFSSKSRLAAAALLAIALSACVSRPYPVRQSYALSLETPSAQGPAGAYAGGRRLTMLIGAVVAASGYENRSFVYRVGPNQMESDFYNEWTAPPARLLADQTAQYLDAVGSKVRVARNSGLNPADLALEIYLESIYGDYAAGPPSAVLNIRFVAADLRRGVPKVILDKTYRAVRSVSGRNPADLVDGFHDCLRDILDELGDDLARWAG